MTTSGCLFIHLDAAENRLQIQELVAQQLALSMSTREFDVVDHHHTLPTFSSTYFGASMLARLPNSGTRLRADDGLV